MIDCSDLARSADFWARVLGYVFEGPAVGTYQGLIPADGQGVAILLQRVPERKDGKNRLHLDLRTPDLDAEVRRVVGIGASLLTSRPTRSTAGAGTFSAIPMATSSASSSRRTRPGRPTLHRPKRRRPARLAGQARREMTIARPARSRAGPLRALAPA